MTHIQCQGSERDDQSAKLCLTPQAEAQGTLDKSKPSGKGCGEIQV